MTWRAVEQRRGTARLLRVAALGERREADQIREEHRDEPRSACAREGSAARAGPPSLAQSPQNFAPGVFAAPHAGQASASFAPHSAQNFRPASFAVPHSGQLIRSEYGSDRRSAANEQLVPDPVGLVGLGAEPPVAVCLVLLVGALEPHGLRVSLESEDVGRDAVEEPAVVR